LLILLKAPAILLTTVVALLAGSIVTALFNTFYRVSYHLTALTIMVIMTAYTWGVAYLLLALFIPLVFWAKFRIREHTIPQLLEGMAVAVVVCLGCFAVFRLISHRLFQVVVNPEPRRVEEQKLRAAGCRTYRAELTAVPFEPGLVKRVLRRLQ
jgi:uncharacterized membrane protein